MESGVGEPQFAVAPATVGLRPAYAGWMEVFKSNIKGRKEVHYYLKRKDGSLDLVVVGKERSRRRMAYHYAFQNLDLIELAPCSSLAKLRSRREVINWLSSVVPDSTSNDLPDTVAVASCDKHPCELDLKVPKASQLQKPGQHLKWLGSSWTCKKKRRHFEAFSRYGVKISVNTFVYVLAEEGKRLVAYLDDMYEDSRGNRMVVVRWFHKIDEVGIDLPRNFNDREIFFSLCLQDLSIQCVEGLASVLSPRHFDEFMNEAKHTPVELFMCHRQYDHDELKPFDITLIKGYWKQDVLRNLCSDPPSRAMENSQPSNAMLNFEGYSNSIGFGTTSRKRIRLLIGGVKLETQCPNRRDTAGSCLTSLAESQIKKERGDASVSRKEASLEMPPPSHLIVGCQVEVLSQDSGLRGCWFRALIIKKHKDKVKLRYLDLKDADNESHNLEEWVLSSRTAGLDDFGLRVPGRITIRPPPVLHNGKVSRSIETGTIIDAWWCDGWWEGIVIRPESEGRLLVYFPGEKREAVFRSCDLRHSQEWSGNIWKDLVGRPDIAASILSDLVTRGVVRTLVDGKNPPELEEVKGGSPNYHEDYARTSPVVCLKNTTTHMAVPDLSKDVVLSKLKWSSRKRRRFGDNSRLPVGSKERSKDLHNQSSPPKVKTESFKSFKADRENCKNMGDSLFNSSMVPRLSNLVMSR